MAELKKKTLSLSGGKLLKLYGNSIAISKSLEIGEGYAPNIYSFTEDNSGEKDHGKVTNPYNLDREDLMELVDFNIQLWMNLKANLRKYGVDSPRIFNQDTIKV